MDPLDHPRPALPMADLERVRRPARRVLRLGVVSAGLLALVVGLLAWSFHSRVQCTPDRPDGCDRSCERGDASACVNLGILLELGERVDRDLGRAEVLYARACDLRQPAGCYNQGRLQAAVGDPAAAERALALYERACDGSVGVGCGEAGRLLPRKDRVSLERVATHFTRGCDLGDDTSCFDLGELRRDRPSLGGEAAARPLFQRACGRSHADACERVGRLTIGYGTSAELAAAFPSLDKACSLGSTSGCSSLAWVMARSPVPAELPDAGAMRQARLTAAYLAAAAGRAGQARALAEPFLREEGPAAARVILACVALDQGRLDEAKALLVPLRAASPPDSAVSVLTRLIDRRVQKDEAWPDAMVEAWAAAGKPDVRASRLLGGAEALGTVPPSPRLRRPQGGGTNAFVIAYLEDLPPDAAGLSAVAEPVPAALVEQALDLHDDARDEIRLLALSVLTKPGIPEALRPRARAAARGSLGKLADRHPDEAAWLLWDLVLDARLDTPMSDAEVARLESAASRRRWGVRFGALYGAYRAHLVPLDPSGARERAFGLAVDLLGTELASTLSRRVRATADGATADARQRLARASRTLGDLLARNGTLLEAAVAGRLLRTAADVSGSDDDAEHADEVRAGFRQNFDEWGSTRSAIGSWPLRRYTEEWMDAAAEGELAFFEHLRRVADRR